VQAQFAAIVDYAVRDLHKIQTSVELLLAFFGEVANNVRELVTDCHKTMTGELEESLDDFIFPEYLRDVCLHLLRSVVC